MGQSSIFLGQILFLLCGMSGDGLSLSQSSFSPLGLPVANCGPFKGYTSDRWEVLQQFGPSTRMILFEPAYCYYRILPQLTITWKAAELQYHQTLMMPVTLTGPAFYYCRPPHPESTSGRRRVIQAGFRS